MLKTVQLCHISGQNQLQAREKASKRSNILFLHDSCTAFPMTNSYSFRWDRRKIRSHNFRKLFSSPSEFQDADEIYGWIAVGIQFSNCWYFNSFRLCCLFVPSQLCTLLHELANYYNENQPTNQMMSSHLFYPSYFSSALLLRKLLVSQASHF